MDSAAPVFRAKLCLDVGCGANKPAEYVGMDTRDLPGVDIVHDAETIPWPLEDGVCEVVRMCHFVEHVKPWRILAVMDEAWRVLRRHGELKVVTPYGGSFRWHQDPTHCLSWNEATIQYFVPGFPLYEVYQPRPWGIKTHSGEAVHYWDVHGDVNFTLVKLSDDEVEGVADAKPE